MTRRLLFAVALVGALSAAAAAPAVDFVVDNAHTSLIFGVKHMNISYTYGRFNKVMGKYSLDAANPAASKFAVAIEVDSIDTGLPQRDVHLKNADFFNAGEFPEITFLSTKVETKQDGEHTIFVVTGDFTMHGVTKPMTFELRKLGEGDGPFGYRSGFICHTKLKRSDFGMNKMLEMVGDDVTITLSFEGARPDAAAPAGATGAVTPAVPAAPPVAKAPSAVAAG